MHCTNAQGKMHGVCPSVAMPHRLAVAIFIRSSALWLLNKKEKSTPFCDHNQSLLRRQPRVETIGHSPEGEGRSQRMVDQAYSVWFCLSGFVFSL